VKDNKSYSEKKRTEVTPSRKKQNYSDYSNQEQQGTRAQKFIKKNGIYTLMIITTLGLFIGIPSIFWFASTTVISVGSILLMLFVCGGLGLIQWRYIHVYLDMAYHQFTMYAFAGFGMCLLNFIFLLNYNISIGSHSENYFIKSACFNNGSYDVELLNSAGTSAAVESAVGHFIGNNYERMPTSKNISVTFDRGLFGMDIIHDCKFN
jgi:hypothetical protein